MIKANGGRDAVQLATALCEVGHGDDEIVIRARDLVSLVEAARRDGQQDAECARSAMTDADTAALTVRLMREAANLDIDHPPLIPRDETDDSTGPRADEGTEGPRAPAVGLDLTPELAVLRALLWHVPAVDQEQARLDALAVADATPGGAIMAQALVRMASASATRTWSEDDGA